VYQNGDELIKGKREEAWLEAPRIVTNECTGIGHLHFRMASIYCLVLSGTRSTGRKGAFTVFCTYVNVVNC
jgi:hypothetical protein